jgi:hypothetical protein
MSVHGFHNPHGVTDLLRGTYAEPASMLQLYHGFVDPATDFLEHRLSVPHLIAPILTICGGVFVPLFFVGSLLFSALGYHGSVKCVLLFACALQQDVVVSVNRLNCQINAPSRRQGGGCHQAHIAYERYTKAAYSMQWHCADGRCQALCLLSSMDVFPAG